MVSERACLIGRDFQSLFEAGSFAGLTDGQLLERFHSSLREVAEAAFDALVKRHGPMVLRSCQRILRNDHDAQDAFQATFLILARKAVTIRNRKVLAGWLSEVAHRMAVKARGHTFRKRNL